MTEAQQMWLWALLLPALMFVGQNMCVWSGPRFLGPVALGLLWMSAFTVFVFLAAVPASVYLAATGFICRKADGELPRRVSLSLACVCFMALWILSLRAASSLRHRAFVQSSHVGDRVVQALARYRNDNGEYPGSLDPLFPAYLRALPYTGMIAYPEFTYRKDSNDIQSAPGSYELRIDCTAGMINFDRFIYWPSETYPDRIQNKPVERIRAWAYVHE